MNQKQIILRGAFILTVAGFLSRIMGFFYRIFLSRIIGAEGLGLYQLIFPIFGLAMSVTAMGIQTAISHYVSGKIALGDKTGSRKVFFSGVLLSLTLSVLVSMVLFSGADFLAVHFLKEERTAELLRYLSFAVPFASFHSCAIGYFMGQKKTGIPSVSQLFEQAVRIFSALLLHGIFVEKGIPITPLVAVIAMIAAEFLTSLFTLTLLLLETVAHRASFTLPSFKDILSVGKMAAPLSGNRLCLSALQSLEAVLIPTRLKLFGYTAAEALSHYGVLTGMALPLVMFPSAITGALSMLLVPTVSEAHTLNNRSQIARTVEATITGCLILGIFCTGAFLLFGEDLGLFLFGSPEAGNYILILGWICPFMYLGTTMASILNGLGKTVTTFLQNLCGLTIRIVFIWFCIPHLGMTGYLLGLLASQLTVAFLSLFSLSRTVHFAFHIKSALLLPVRFLLIAVLLLQALDRIWNSFTFLPSDFFLLFVRGLIFTGCYGLLTFYFIRE